MSKQVIRSLVEDFLINGGQVQLCPTRTAFGGGSRQRRLADKNDAHA